jgi:putative transcription antitermination factor YqgF
VRRLLGIDLGERRIGLAIADGDGSPARAFQTIRRGRTPVEDADRIKGVVAANEIGELVVGLPLEAAGHAGTQAQSTRQWVAAISPLVGLPVSLRDERLTSHLAEQRLGPMKRGRSGGPPTPAQREAHRARVDREAAAIILQDELVARAAAAWPAEKRDDTEASR